MVEDWSGIGHVRRIEYDVATKNLDVQFENGRRYRYSGVEYPEWEALMRADSKGAHVRRIVQPRHRFQELKP
jgi:hypothetical protein